MKTNQTLSKSHLEKQNTEENRPTWNGEVAKLCKRSEDLYMKVLLEDLSKIDLLMGNQDSPKTPISRDADQFSSGSQLRKLSILGFNWSALPEGRSSLSSEGTSQSKKEIVEKQEPLPNNIASEDRECSASMESQQEDLSKNCSDWKELKDSYKSNPRKSNKGIELFKDDTFMHREEKEEDIFATPKNQGVSNISDVVYIRPHNNSFSIAANALFKTSSERKPPFSSCPHENQQQLSSKKLKLKAEEQIFIAALTDVKAAQQNETPESGNQGKSKVSLIQRRNFKAVTLETKFKGSHSLDNLQKNYRFYCLLRPSTWEVNSLSLASYLLEESFPFKIALCPVTCPHVLGLVHTMNSSGSTSQIECVTPWPNLNFNHSKISNGDTRFKSSHPIRSKQVQHTLIEHLKAETISSVASCHIFVAKEFKKVDSGSFFRSVSGNFC